MRTINKILALLAIALCSIPSFGQTPKPAGFPSPYSTNWYRVGYLQTDSGMIDAPGDTTIRPRFMGYRIIWAHAGIDTSEWFYTGAKWVRLFRQGDPSPSADSSIFATKYDVDTAKGNLRISINQKIGLTSLSADAPLVYNNVTGKFTCPTCSVSSSGITSLNGLTAATQTFAFDMTGTNFGVTSSGSVHTFHGPIVNGSDTGVVTPALFATWNAKQNAITTGSTTQYFRGDLSLATFPTRVSQFSNDAGYITNNQTITFTAIGDVTGTYANPTALNPTLTIGNNKVTYGKIQAAVGAQVLLGAQVAGNYQEITIGSGLSMIGGVLSSTGGGGSGNTNSNIGSGFRWAVPNTNNIKTFFVVGGTLDSTTNANAITLTITGGSGNTNSNIGSGFRLAVPGTNNIKTLFGSLIIWDSTSNTNALTATADTTSGNQKLSTQGFVTRGFQPIGNYQGLLSNTGTGFRIFSPQTGIKTLFCAGCTIDSTTNANSLTITVTGGGGGNTNSNIGSGFRWAVLNTNNIKTFFAATGFVLDSTTNTNALTFSTSVNGIMAGNGTGVSAVTVSSPLTFSTGTLGIQIANTSQIGAISSTDWNTFNGKQGALSNIGSGFRIFSPQAGVKTFFCVGCTLDSTTNTNALTLTVSGSGLSGNGFVFQAASTTSYVSGSATNLIGYNASGTSSTIILGSNLSMTGNTINATGGVPSLTAGHIFIGGASNTATDTAFVNDIMQMQEIAQWIPELGQNSTPDSIPGYHYDRVDSTLMQFTTSGVGGENGGWLTGAATGDSMQVGPPIGVIIGNSIAAGHPALKGRLETGGGVGGFISNYPDSAGQLSYELRALTNMRWYNMGIGGQTTVQIKNRFLRDAIGLTINVGDGRPNQTLPRRPSFVIIEGAVNDFFATIPSVPLGVTKSNILWMVDICKQYHIPCVVMNSTGDAISGQAQLASIKAFNDWLKTGVLSAYGCYVYDMNAFWNDPAYGNDNIHHIAAIADDIHFTKAGYAALAIDMATKSKLPVLDSLQFLTALAPTNAITNYARPTSVTIGRGTQYSTTYSLANSPTVTIPVTAPIMDSTWYLVNTSATVVGAGTRTGFSSIIAHLSNNPTHQIWRTQKATFAGGFTGVINNTNLNIQGRDGGGDTTIDARLYDGNNRAFQMFTSNSGAVFLLNGLLTATRFSNAILNVNAPGATGIGTNGNIFSSGATSQIANLQLTFNAHATTTGFGISNSNSGQSGFRFETSATAGGSDFLFTYWNEGSTTSKTVTAASSGQISNYDFPLGYLSFNTTNQTANVFRIHPTFNNTGSFSGSLYVGINYNPTITALNGATHYGIWIQNGLSVFGTAGDPVLINTTTNNNGFLQIGANTTTIASMFFNGASSDVSSPTSGMLWYNSTTHALNFRDNGTTINLLAGGGGSQTWQQTLTSGSTLNTTNSITNTGQSFTWNNGGTGTFKLSGILTDTTNAAYILFKKKDSSVAEMSFANLVNYLPADTLNAANGLNITGTGLNHTMGIGGPLNQNTTINMGSFSFTFTGNSGTVGLVLSPSQYVQTVGALAVSGWNVITTTGNVTTSGTSYAGNVLDNPASAQTSYTFEMPSSPVDGMIVNLHFGGTIASGSTVTTSFTATVHAGTGAVIYGATPSATVVSGDYFSWKYYAAGNSWYRER